MRGMQRMRRDGESGAVTVEFGLVFPLVALLIAGMVTFGLALTARLTLSQAAREGVRAYAFEGGDPTAVTRSAADSLPADEIVVTFGDCDLAAPGSQAWVQAAYDFPLPPPISLLTAIGLPEELPLSAKAVMRCGG